MAARVLAELNLASLLAVSAEPFQAKHIQFVQGSVFALRPEPG